MTHGDHIPDLTPWGIAGASVRVTAPDRGTNNLVRLISSPHGEHVWRRYDNLHADQVAAEHTLLAWISTHTDEFEVPRPLRTLGGRTVVVDTEGRAAALHPRIPGRRPDDSASGVLLAAAAFARLLRVLADAPREPVAWDWAAVGLHAVHPGIEDTGELLADLSDRGVAVGWVEETVAADPALRRRLATLPRQVIHGDIALSNALSDGRRITGVLDFELSGWDGRAVEVAAAVHGLGGQPDAPHGTRRIPAVREVFARELDLTDAELALLPDLVRRRLAGSVLWRAGRWRAGAGTIAEVAQHAADGAARLPHLGLYG